MKIEEKIITILQNNLENPDIEITLQSDLQEDLHIDSLLVMMLIEDLETEFDISIDATTILELKNVADIVTKLKSLYPELAKI